MLARYENAFDLYEKRNITLSSSLSGSVEVLLGFVQEYKEREDKM